MRRDLILLNTKPSPQRILKAACRGSAHLGSATGVKGMADKQQDGITSQTAAPAEDGLRTAGLKAERRIQDALEDDEVREALRLLHGGRRKQGDEAV